MATAPRCWFHPAPRPRKSGSAGEPALAVALQLTPSMDLAPARPVRQDGGIDDLFRTHGRTVRYWARGFARSASDADDIVQEVFMLVHRHAELIRKLTNPQGWLLRVTRNVARHYWRSQARQSRRDLAWNDSAHRRHSIDPLAELEAREVVRCIGGVLATLNARSAEVYRLAEIERLSTNAISALMSMSPVAVRVRRYRIRGMIAQRLALLNQGTAAATGQ